MRVNNVTIQLQACGGVLELAWRWYLQGNFLTTMTELEEVACPWRTSASRRKTHGGTG
jgi:hypothetical protein